jgi:hypothetical protein
MEKAPHLVIDDRSNMDQMESSLVVSFQDARLFQNTEKKIATTRTRTRPCCADVQSRISPLDISFIFSAMNEEKQKNKKTGHTDYIGLDRLLFVLIYHDIPIWFKLVNL